MSGGAAIHSISLGIDSMATTTLTFTMERLCVMNSPTLT